jgi:hypothetical protein
MVINITNAQRERLIELLEKSGDCPGDRELIAYLKSIKLDEFVFFDYDDIPF